MNLATDVLFSDDKENMAGVKGVAFIGRVASFQLLQTPVANPTTYEARVTIATAHTLNLNSATIKCFSMYEKSGVESPMVGGRKSKSFKPKYKFFYPGTDAACIGFLGEIKNSDLVAFIPQMDEAGYIQIGAADLAASIVSGSVKTGEGPEGEKGVMFEIEAPCREAWFVYTAALPRLGV